MMWIGPDARLGAWPETVPTSHTNQRRKLRVICLGKTRYLKLSSTEKRMVFASGWFSRSV